MLLGRRLAPPFVTKSKKLSPVSRSCRDSEFPFPRAWCTCRLTLWKVLTPHNVFPFPRASCTCRLTLWKVLTQHNVFPFPRASCTCRLTLWKVLTPHNVFPACLSHLSCIIVNCIGKVRSLHIDCSPIKMAFVVGTVNDTLLLRHLLFHAPTRLDFIPLLCLHFVISLVSKLDCRV